MFTPSRISLRFAIGLAAVAGLLACDSITAPEPPDRPAFGTGTIAGLDITHYPDGMGIVETAPNIWLDRAPGRSCGTLLNFEGSPELLRQLSDDQYTPVSRSELVIGMDVQFWIHPGWGTEDRCPGYIAPSHIVVSAPR